jgi:hypothetical protein
MEDSAMKVGILDEHRWLEGFTGDWQMIPDPNAPPEERTDDWIESGRMLEGGAWLVIEGSGTMPGGGAATTIFTVGFDASKGKYVGTWVGSMMAHLWICEGIREGNSLALNSLGPSFDQPGLMQTYQDIYTLDSASGRSLKSQVLQDDGTWKVFMTARYRRK